MPRRPLTSEQRAYLRRMATLVDGRDPLRLLRTGVDKITVAVRGLPGAALGRRPTPTKWSVHEIVGHLLDYEVATSWRLRLMVAQPGSRLEGWDQDAWAAAFRYRRMPFDALLRALRVGRAANLRLIETMPRRALRRAWYHHAERGPENSSLFLVMWAGHDLNHLEQIRRIRARSRRRA